SDGGDPSTTYSGLNCSSPDGPVRPVSTSRPSRSARLLSSSRSTLPSSSSWRNRAGSSSDSSPGRPLAVTSRRSDHRLVARSAATAVTTSYAAPGSPVTAIGPLAASRSTSTSRPSASRPSDTSPGYGATPVAAPSSWPG